MDIEAPGDPGKKSAQTEGQQFISGCIYSGCPGSDLVLPYSVEYDAGLGSGDLPHNESQYDHEGDRDIVIDRPRAGEGVAAYTAALL
ncbi:unnamed protein product, partial [marine sediment metagenome]